MQEYRILATEIVAALLRAGATAADVYIDHRSNLSAALRGGEVSELKQSVGRGIGLRAIFNGAVATAHSTHFQKPALLGLAGQTVELARTLSADRFAGLAPRESLGIHLGDLKIFDPGLAAMSPEARKGLTRAAEAAALAFDPRVRSEGTQWFDNFGHVTLANSNGFLGQFRSTFGALVMRVLAEDGGTTHSLVHTHVGRRAAAFRAPEVIGREAARAVVGKIGAKTVASQAVPVVAAPGAASRLLSWFARGASGPRVAAGASFLAGKIGQQVASPLVTIVDDPLLEAGPSSYPFDAEGVRSARTVIVEKGVLKNIVTDPVSARRLQLPLTANAARSYERAPEASLSNTYVEQGTMKQEALIAQVRSGLLLTGIAGTGFNTVSGDFSQSASGRWIENGKLTHAVDNITIAGNIVSIFRDVQGVGTDLGFDQARPGDAMAAPSLLIGRMALGGSEDR